MVEFSFKNVVLVGCKFLPPKGGIAQVLFSYKNDISSDYHFVINSGPKNSILKLLVAIFAAIELFFLLLFHSNIRIVHIHTASYKSFERSVVSFRIAKLLKRKVIMHIHGGGFKKYYQTKPEYISSILNRCDSVVALSKEWQSFFKSITTCKNVTIINNVVTSPSYKDIEKSDEQFHLLFLGLICKEKGIYDLIEVIDENKEYYSKCLVFHVAGNGEADRVRVLVAQKHLANLIKVEGWVSGEQKKMLLNKCDAYILPSYTEGLPISILEAMSYGKPILATRVGGIPEIVENHVNGILFNPANKLEMNNALKLLIKNPEMCKTFGYNSLEKSKPFLPEAVKQSLISLYSKVIDS